MWSELALERAAVREECSRWRGSLEQREQMLQRRNYGPATSANDVRDAKPTGECRRNEPREGPVREDEIERKSAHASFDFPGGMMDGPKPIRAVRRATHEAARPWDERREVIEAVVVRAGFAHRPDDGVSGPDERRRSYVMMRQLGQVVDTLPLCTAEPFCG
jgi:hypothetical protein